MLSSNSAETETAVKAASQSTVLHRSEPNSQSDQQLIRAFSFSSPWNSFPETGFILFLGDSWLPAPCCWREVWQIGNWTTSRQSGECPPSTTTRLVPRVGLKMVTFLSTQVPTNAQQSHWLKPKCNLDSVRQSLRAGTAPLSAQGHSHP